MLKFVGTGQDLIDNGWQLISNSWQLMSNVDSEATQMPQDYNLEGNYVRLIDYSRRGQAYYYVIDSSTNIVNIYATQPDGMGASVELDIKPLLNLMNKGLLVEVGGSA